jgi:hypothetical protein
MSSGLECLIAEVEKGKWYYLLQDWSCPSGAWDWEEEASAYGPFGTQEAAHQHLRDNHSNPGGHTVYELGELEITETRKKWIAAAVNPEKPDACRRW